MIHLTKVRAKTPFAFVDPIRVEPLELEYIQGALEAIGHESIIHDPLFDKAIRKNPLAPYKNGDVVILNGYNTARDDMIKLSHRIKARYPNTILIGSGVDVQRNHDLYRDGSFDYLVTSHCLSSLQQLIQTWSADTPGVGSKKQNGQWHFTPWSPLLQAEAIQATRSYFKTIQEQTTYVHYKNVALIKGAHSCPYPCAFCYCKTLNQGHHVMADYRAIFEEMRQVKADYYWIVDDVFVYDQVSLNAFLEAFKEDEAKRNEGNRTGPPKLIVYLRADFIANNLGALHRLKDSGVVEVIIGFESIKSDKLNTYQKGYGDQTTHKAIENLHRVDLAYTGLFMVHPDDYWADFKALMAFIRQVDMKQYTFSIYTPLRGTALYEEEAHQIVDHRSASYDFLHAVLPPRMGRLPFTLAFAALHLFQVCHSQSARQVLAMTLLRRLRGES